MIRKFTLFFWLFLSALTLKAQAPSPCGPGQPPADECQDACIYCDFNGYVGSTAGYSSEILLHYCSVIENDQWLGFIAGGTSATFTATPSNCTFGNGIQMAIYPQCDGSPLPGGCDPGAPGHGNLPVSVTVSLTPGLNYYLLIDGYSGDVCTFQLTVSPVSAVQPQPVGNIGAMGGVSTLCPGGTATFHVPPVNSAGGYTWSLPAGWLVNGEPGPLYVGAPAGNSVQITAGPATGQNFQICVQASNACYDGPSTCRSVNVQNIVSTILSPAILCFGTPSYILPWGDEVLVSGTYSAVLPSYLGCDSMVTQTVSFKPPIVTNLPNKTICPGDCVTICGSDYCSSGDFQGVCQSFLGCDSIVNFTLQLAHPVAKIIQSGTHSCDSSSVLLTASPSPPGTSFKWKNLAGVVLGTDTSFIVPAVGTYILTATMSGAGASCSAADTIMVTNISTTPPSLNASGATLTCFVDSVQLTTNTNAINPVFAWSGPNGFLSNVAAPTVTQPGLYSLTVTANSGCTASATATVILNNMAPGASATATGVISCASLSANLFGGPDTLGNTFFWEGTGFVSHLQNPVVNQSGTFILTVTGTNGCASSDSVTIANDTAIPDVDALGGMVDCAHPTTQLVSNSQTMGVSFSWTGPNNFSSNFQNPEVEDPGDYTVNVIAGNGCSATKTVTVLQDTVLPDIQATGSIIDCNHPLVGITASSLKGVSFAWTGPNNFSSNLQNPSVNNGGTYTVTTVGSNGCSSSASVTVVLDLDTPDVSILPGDTLTCLVLSTGIQASVTSSGSAIQGLTWTGPNGFISNQQNPNVANPGVYMITVTALNGCTTTDSVRVYQNIILPDATAQGGTLTCASPQIQLDGHSATSGVIYHWTGPNNFNTTLEDPSVNVDGLYTLTVTGQNGCFTTMQVTVNLDKTVPDLNALSSNNLDCAALSATLTASSMTDNVTYLWTGPNNFSVAMPITSTTLAGDYQVVITASNGCVATSTVHITQDTSVPDATAFGGEIDCVSGQATLSGISQTPGVSFAWTGPNNFQSGLQNPVASAEGQYALTVTGPNGCMATATATVSQNILSPQVALSGGGTVTCTIPDVTIVGTIATPNATGLWTGPNNFNSALDSITVSIPGVYTYTVTAQNGCIAAPASTVLINIQPPQQVMASGGQLSCISPSIQLSGNSSTTGVTYLWDGPNNFMSNLSNPSVTSPGTYTLIIIDPLNGCTSSVTVEVTQDPTVPNISIVSDSITCSQVSVVLNASSSNGDVSFHWTGPNGFASTLEDPTTNLPGNYQVTITANSSGCSATTSYTVIQNIHSPGVNAEGDTLTCAAPNGQLASQSNAINSSYTWSGPSGFSANVPNPAVTEPGAYTVTITSTNGCISTASVTVVSDMISPVLNVSGGTINCMDTSIVLSALTDVTVSWQWSGPGNFHSNLQNPSVMIAGNYTLTATATNGCTSTQGTMVLTDNENPGVIINNPAELDCNNAQIGLTGSVSGSGPFTYQWTTLNGNILSGGNTLTALVDHEGSYQLNVVNNSNGCSSIATTHVFANNNIPNGVDIRKENVTCFGDKDGAVQINQVTGGIPPYTYSLDNQAFAPNNSYNQLAPGAHTLIVKDANGCEYETNVEIIEPNELIVDLGPDTTIHFGEAITLSLDHIVNFPGRVTHTEILPIDLKLDSTFLPAYTFQYQVTVYDSNGCKASDDRHIRVDRNRWVYIPNIFNPGSSENNQITVFGGPDVENIKSFIIYDRWGDQVYSARDFDKNDLSKGWDGKTRGQEVNPGVFVYYAEIRFKDGEVGVYKGDITVVK